MTFAAQRHGLFTPYYRHEAEIIARALSPEPSLPFSVEAASARSMPEMFRARRFSRVCGYIFAPPLPAIPDAPISLISRQAAAYAI